MSKINNYIVLSIAEKTYEEFLKSGYSTYPNFCKSIGDKFLNNILSKKEVNIVYRIMDEIKIIYNLEYDVTYDYIHYFFSLKIEEYGEYYKYLRTVEELFPFFIYK